MNVSPGACPLCLVILDALSSTASSRPENTELLSTEHFVVHPALGPLVPGHVLVTSRRHATSLAALGSGAINDYEVLAQTLRRSGVFLHHDVLEAEHGSTGDECAGACVVHAHVHWIPGCGDLEEAFEGILERINGIATVAELAHVDVPYLLIRGSSGNTRVYNAHDIPSQFVSHVICSILGLPEWDWRQRTDHVETVKTIQVWRAAFANDS